MRIDLEVGMLVSTPFSYSCKKSPKDAENQVEAALGAARAIKLAHGTTFKVRSHLAFPCMSERAQCFSADWELVQAVVQV